MEWPCRKDALLGPSFSVFPLLGFSCEHSLFYFVTKDEILYPSTGTGGCLTRLKTIHGASAYMKLNGKLHFLSDEQIFCAC